MNPNVSTHPRLVCRIARTWGGRFPALVAAHRASCPECGAFFAAGDELELALRREASIAPRVQPAAGFELRIAQAVRAATTAPAARPQPSRRAPLAWAGFATAGIAAAAVALLVSQRAFPPAGEAQAGELADFVVQEARNLGANWETKVLPATQQIVADNPVQEELDLVYTDARNALKFLSANFLPTSDGAAAAVRRS